MTRKLLDYDPLTREAVWFEMKDDVLELHQTQDVTPILELNKRLANNDDYSKKGMKKDWWHYASIPNIVALKWLKEKGVDVMNKAHEKKVFQLLNDPEYRYLKATTKRHGVK